MGCSKSTTDTLNINVRNNIFRNSKLGLYAKVLYFCEGSASINFFMDECLFSNLTTVGVSAVYQSYNAQLMQLLLRNNYFKDIIAYNTS